MTHNDITGEALITKPASDKYRNGWDAIFGKKEEPKPEDSKDEKQTSEEK